MVVCFACCLLISYFCNLSGIVLQSAYVIVHVTGDHDGTARETIKSQDTAGDRSNNELNNR